jgi:voltage-gated potassium channel Kch
MSSSRGIGLWRVDLLIIVTVSALVSLIVLGTVAYHYLEKWSWVSSFYFTVCTLTTIGYGDLVPTTDTSRLFTAFFALAGVTIAFTSLSALGAIYLRRGESILSKVGEHRPK